MYRFNGSRKQPVEIHRIDQLVPDNPLGRIERSKQHSGVVGPLNAADPASVESYVNEKSGAVSSDLLWQLISVVSTSKGRLRSASGMADPHSPEVAIVDLLLQDSQNGANGLPPPLQSINDGPNGKFM